MKYIFLFGLLWFCVSITHADSAPPTMQTTFYFQKDGKPFTQAMPFTITCYGRQGEVEIDKNGDFDGWRRGKTTSKISTLSDVCKQYGCTYDTSNIFEVYRADTDYCDITLESDGKNILINHFATSSGTDSGDMNGIDCHSKDYDINIDNFYFKETPQYQPCMDEVWKEYYPGGVDNFICDKFSKKVSKSKQCAGWGCYQDTQKTLDCRAEKDKKEHACNVYLEDVTAKLQKSEEGFPFDKLCTTTISLPKNTEKYILNVSEKKQSTSTLPTTHEQPKNLIERFLDTIRCMFLRLFGKSCSL